MINCRTVTTCLLLACLAATTRAQTLDQVRTAVHDYIGDDAVSGPARAQLHAWGTGALPHLRTLAGQHSAFGYGAVDDEVELILALRDIDDPAALDLLLDMLDDKTGVRPVNVLILAVDRDGPLIERLQGDARFKQLIYRFTLAERPDLSLERCQAASIIASMRWEEGEDVLEAMLDDKDRSVVTAAAIALKTLTGRSVTIAEPPIAFPVMTDEAPPFGAMRSYPGSGWIAAASGTWPYHVAGNRIPCRFGLWSDDRPGLLQMSEHALVFAGASPGRKLAHWDLRVQPIDVLSLVTADRGQRWIVATGEDASFLMETTGVAGLDDTGKELWSWTAREAARSFSMTALRRSSGVAGVVLGVGGKDGLVALDLDGHPLWSTWNPLIHSVHSHPDLPDRVLTCGGDLTLHDADGKRLTTAGGRTITAPLGYFYAHEAALFADGDGGAAVIASGEGMNSEALIVRLDASLRMVWRASVPEEVKGLVALEREQVAGSPYRYPPLFAAVTGDGQLLVFDEDGELCAPLRISNAPKLGDSVSVYGMDAGRLPDGSRALLIGLSDKTLLYPYR